LILLARLGLTTPDTPCLSPSNSFWIRVDSNFDGADFTNAIIDRASFSGSSLKGAIFTNAVLTGTSFEGADVTDSDFTEAALGGFDIKGLCRNPTLKGQNPTTGNDTRESVGCF
jgi:uncharacterized protein YjbI with pentapeptide repeats